MVYAREIVGERVSIRWTGDPGKPWYAGRIADFEPASCVHLVKYDDGDQRRHDITSEEANGQLRWLSAAAPEKRKSKPSKRAAEKPMQYLTRVDTGGGSSSAVETGAKGKSRASVPDSSGLHKGKGKANVVTQEVPVKSKRKNVERDAAAFDNLLSQFSDDQLECVLQFLEVHDLIPVACASKDMHVRVRGVCSQAASLDTRWSNHWQSWHSRGGTSARAIKFMLSLDASRIPKEIFPSGSRTQVGEDPKELAHMLEAKEARAWRGRRRRRQVPDCELQYRADRDWPRQTADGGAVACMQELSRQDQRYRTLAACHLHFDEDHVDRDAELESRTDVVTHPPFHKPMTGDIFSCDLIMRQFGDGTGRVRGWPGRSDDYDTEEQDGFMVPIGYQGVIYGDHATRLILAGQEVLMSAYGELHDDRHCYPEQVSLARVRLLAPGQTFTAERIEFNKHVGSAKMTTQAGDLEICFNGDFGQVCHIMRPVPMGSSCSDPLEGEGGCVMTESGTENPAGKWWDSGHDEDDDYISSWYTRYDLNGDAVYDPEAESEDDE